MLQLGSPTIGPITHLSFLGYNGTIEVRFVSHSAFNLVFDLGCYF